ncbi:hypothetical protein ACNJX9_31020 [Bradyrhizobium sp. DASA03076]|uniref:hypothetical protein n=1 Tax=Bradyrhizobium sp. BLXBL-03 TaxID=3395916 RepID=UPI003F723410
MAQRATFRADFRDFIALYLLAVDHNENHYDASRLHKLFVPTRSTCEDLLDPASDPAGVYDPISGGRAFGPSGQAVDRAAKYDHASAFLHAVLKGVGPKTAP